MWSNYVILRTTIYFLAVLYMFSILRKSKVVLMTEKTKLKTMNQNIKERIKHVIEDIITMQERK